MKKSQKAYPNCLLLNNKKIACNINMTKSTDSSSVNAFLFSISNYKFALKKASNSVLAFSSSTPDTSTTISSPHFTPKPISIISLVASVDFSPFLLLLLIHIYSPFYYTFSSSSLVTLSMCIARYPISASFNLHFNICSICPQIYLAVSNACGNLMPI